MVYVEDYSLERVKQGLADGSIILIDIREDNEWAAGHIPGAIHRPLSRLDVAALPAEEGKRVVLYCRSGQRTLKALYLAQMGGRDDVTAHFGGSMLVWAAAGEPIETP